MGACLAQSRPGVREISINYCGGSYYNFGPGRFTPAGPQQRQIRLCQHDDALVLDLPAASEAAVPQRLLGLPPLAGPKKIHHSVYYLEYRRNDLYFRSLSSWVKTACLVVKLVVVIAW
jgi:hypothetical protein